MPIYTVTFTETETREAEVEADSPEHARQLVLAGETDDSVFIGDSETEVISVEDVGE